MQPKTYAICTTPRSGSNFLCSLLHNTGALGEPEESFNPDRVKTRSPKPEDGALPRAHTKAYIETLMEQHSSPNGIFGVKILFEDFEHFCISTSFLTYLKESYIIILSRKNKIRQAISYYLASLTNQWIAEDQPRLPREHIPFDYDIITSHLHRLCLQESLWKAHLSALQKDFQEIYYEDLCLDPATYIRNIALQLGAPLPPSFTPKASTIIQEKFPGDVFFDRYIELYNQRTPNASRSRIYKDIIIEE